MHIAQCCKGQLHREVEMQSHGSPHASDAEIARLPALTHDILQRQHLEGFFEAG
jgi:hypothetical protein